MKLLAFVLINRILMIATGGSEAADDDDTLSENDLNDNFMYLYKTNTQSENYLNYRAVYGLRFDQKKRDRGQKPIKVFPDNYSVVDQELSFNDTDRHSNEVISTSVNDLEEVVSDELASSSFESETSSQRNETSNFTISEVEPVADESRKHIMRPNNRVEHALDFLAHRLKQLLKHSTDKARPESKISPHLSSLGRFLNLFSLVRFENVPCLTAMKPLRQLSGTCYSEGVCIELGGIAVDQCAEGFGVCCIFKAGCRSVTHQNVTYFESPGFPLTSQGNLGTCVTTILLARGVKQLLVEFLFFELLPPTDGNCLDDRLVVVGQAMNFKVPVLCGVATGQHMFLDVEGSQRIYLNVYTRTADDRAFSIKVTQLRDNLAPQGCFQYHTGSEGILKTFNYDDNSQIQLNRRPSYFNNLNYSICIRKNPGYCNITYTNELNGREDIFQLTNIDDGGNVIPGPGQAGAEIFSCQDDFIAVNYIRLCGSKLNDGSVSANFNLNIPVKSFMNGPIVIPFKTDNNTVGRGFKLFYFQEKCVNF